MEFDGSNGSNGTAGTTGSNGGAGGSVGASTFAENVTTTTINLIGGNGAAGVVIFEY